MYFKGFSKHFTLLCFLTVNSLCNEAIYTGVTEWDKFGQKTAGSLHVVMKHENLIWLQLECQFLISTGCTFLIVRKRSRHPGG